VDVIVWIVLPLLYPVLKLRERWGTVRLLYRPLMSQALRKLAVAIGRSGTAVVFINQLREKVGIVFVILR